LGGTREWPVHLYRCATTLDFDVNDIGSRTSFVRHREVLAGS
jgi:hypothetical protein